ncbi:MAG: divergent PAP2 family protein [Patescibacteria group bacterium]|nr:divergent PAP2 family protein [Patescibacteria group bacterium]
MFLEFDLEKYAIVIIPSFMWASAQIIKFVVYSLKHGVNWKYLFEYGHMPSSHTACLTSLVFTTGYYQGIDSPVFAVAASIGLLTIYDAVKLRTYIGDYGKTINRFLKESGKKYPRLKERVGHTMDEAVTGAFLGIVGSFILIEILKSLTG